MKSLETITPLTVVCLFLFAGCGSESTGTKTLTVPIADTIATAPGPEPVPELVLAKVEAGPLLQAIFQGEPQGHNVDWSPGPEQRKAFHAGEAAMLRSTAAKPVLFGKAKDRCVVLIETFELIDGKAANCHACAPQIGLAVLKKMDDGWHLEALTRQLGEYGSNGRTGPTSVVKAGPDRSLFRIFSKFGMGGQRSAGYFFFSLAEDGRPPHLVSKQSTLEEYDDPKHNFTTEGLWATLHFAPSGGAYDDIVASITEKKWDNAGNLVKSAHTETYRYGDASGTYAKVE